MINFRLIFTVILSLFLIISNSQPVLASIHTYPESSTQIMYRSRQSLRDLSDRAWQIILYKRIKSGKLITLNLRLVGFPGIIELAHPQKLQITTGSGNIWNAEDILVDYSFPANVGEYDFLEVMRKLNYDTPLRINIPLQGENLAELVVPIFAVKEWRKLFDEVNFW
ncbi:DUF3122 domain-containing protein [Okeania sp. KiyG1]|uniref:DUF3122 domain-containing protein n=1 Tax=Okeania sp. KiyG1 TaxID=2720165 RepID=UPI0019209EAC|nr:DUF3122 domain-containing protein [Okeania sp. KiyG1]GFZ99241.1 hypothetical protein CYANOKiyG1_10670 [Okeania sp. KiyG1]